MPAIERHTTSSRLTLATLAFACALLCLAPVALAVPPLATGSSAVDAKKAEEAAVRAEMERSRLEIAELTQEYLALAKEMGRTKTEISEISTRLAAMEVQIDKADDALARRAVELYRGDRVDMLKVLFTAESLQDLWVRTNYLAKITYRDIRLVKEVRLARSENRYLQEGLYTKMDQLRVMQANADQQRSRIESDLALQQQRAEQISADIARLMWTPVEGGTAPEGGFDPNTVIAETTFRDSSAMSVEQIQAFLEDQPGTLATYRAKDHNGQMKSVAEMIAEASARWGVNPKVVLATLQKEQSLLTKKSPSQHTYDWAMGCGRADSRTYYEYQGFGKQIWCGAEKLAKNGGGWSPGKSMKIDGSRIYPTNAATYSLFRYTPHFKGTMSFWLIYWRYFGDPLA